MKDTLSLYDELLAGGCTESQARAQAKQLGEIGDSVTLAIKEWSNVLTGQLIEVKDSMKKLDNDMFWMRVIGSMMTAAFAGTIFAAIWFK